MNGAFNAPQRKKQPAINVTPLIDVLFILLIFFMVSSTFKEDLAIDITLPQAETASAQTLAVHEIVVDRDGAIYFGDESVSEAALREKILDVLAEDASTPLVLRADDDADFGKVLRVIDIARDLNAANLVIPTDPLRAAPADR